MAIEYLYKQNGEIWAKLDAGSEAYFQRINRTTIPLAQIRRNIEMISLKYPIRIQSLFLELEGEFPSNREMDAYCKHLERFEKKGCQIVEIQIYTVKLFKENCGKIFAGQLEKSHVLVYFYGKHFHSQTNNKNHQRCRI